MHLEHGPFRTNTKNDEIDTTQDADASPRYTDKAKIQEKSEEKQRRKKTRSDEEPTSDEKTEEKEDCRQNSDGDTEEGNSSNTDCDQDSEVSFMGDTDEDIHTAEIEEEDWIEYMKRSTRQDLPKKR